MKSVNQPYKNGTCHSCIHCKQNTLCSVNGKKGAATIPCLAVHACNKYVQQGGQGKIDAVMGKLAKSKLFDDETKKSITNKVTNFLHNHAEKRVARAKAEAKKAKTA